MKRCRCMKRASIINHLASNMTTRKANTSTQRSNKFRKEQGALGRKPKQFYLTDEEKILVDNYIKEVRGEIGEGMELVAIKYSESASVKDLLRIMRMTENNPAISGIDLSLVYKLHTKSLGVNPVISLQVYGSKIKGLNYD